jgi:hypothetical protein
MKNSTLADSQGGLTDMKRIVLEMSAVEYFDFESCLFLEAL